jgi:hypothetical protein
MFLSDLRPFCLNQGIYASFDEKARPALHYLLQEKATTQASVRELLRVKRQIKESTDAKETARLEAVLNVAIFCDTLSLPELTRTLRASFRTSATVSYCLRDAFRQRRRAKRRRALIIWRPRSRRVRLTSQPSSITRTKTCSKSWKNSSTLKRSTKPFAARRSPFYRHLCCDDAYAALRDVH